MDPMQIAMDPKLRELWKSLESADTRAGQPQLAQPRGEVLAFRNGLLTAWIIMTGQTLEEVGDTLLELQILRGNG